jgi:hypothetical protein
MDGYLQPWSLSALEWGGHDKMNKNNSTHRLTLRFIRVDVDCGREICSEPGKSGRFSLDRKLR